MALLAAVDAEFGSGDSARLVGLFALIQEKKIPAPSGRGIQRKYDSL